MIKIKSKNIVSIIIFLGILLTLSIMMYKILSSGIYSPSIGFGNIQIKGFYLRLNNKLILTIDKIDISALQPTRSKTDKGKQEDLVSADEILSWIKKFLFVISYFEKLSVNDIVLGDNLPRSVHYDGTEYEINTPEFTAKFAVKDKRNITELQITELQIISLDIEIQGSLSYQGVKKTLDIDIVISPKEILNQIEQPKLYLRALTDFYKINFQASSSHLSNFESIRPLVAKIKNQALDDWLFKNLQFELAKLHSLSFQSTLDKSFFSKLQKTLTLDLVIESPKIYLSPDVHPIEATRIIVYMNDESLYFIPKDPFFNQTKLNGSKVKITNLFTQPIGVQVSIVSQNAIIDDKLNKLLQIYDVKLPFTSKNSPLQVNLDIDTLSKNKHTTIGINGNISAPQATLEFEEQAIGLEKLQLNFVHTNSKASIELVDTKIDYAQNIQGGLNLLWNLEDFTLQGDLILDKFILNPSTFSKDVQILTAPKESDKLTERIIQAIHDDSQKGLSENLIEINNNELSKINISADLAGEIKTLSLADFGFTIYIGQENIFELSDIAKIYPYSPILKYFDISEGSVKIQTNDFQTFFLNAQLDNLTYPLYDKNNQKITHFVLEGSIDKGSINIVSQDKKLSFIKEGNVIKLILNNYNLRIDEIFSSSIPFFVQINKEGDSKERLAFAERKAQDEFLRAKQAYEYKNEISPHIIYFEAANMDFYLNDYLIPSDFVSMSVRDGVIQGDITYGNGVANLDMAYSRANLRLSNFSDKFLNRVWQRDIFKGGLFSFKGFYDNGILQGQISVQNTIYKDLAIVQNILALIDTIPALITFRKPGLGANGYDIKKGTIDFVLNNDFLVLESIHLVGSSIDVEGGGLVKLKNKELDIVLRASTLKTLTDIVSKIPLINYVVLGDDGKFTTGIVMKGTLDEPQSEINVAEDILLSPFQMVGRILKPLDTLLNNLSKSLEENTESLIDKFTKQRPARELEYTPSTQNLQQSKDLQSKPEERGVPQEPEALEEIEIQGDEDLVNEPNLPQQKEAE